MYVNSGGLNNSQFEEAQSNAQLYPPLTPLKQIGLENEKSNGKEPNSLQQIWELECTDVTARFPKKYKQLCKLTCQNFC